MEEDQDAEPGDDEEAADDENPANRAPRITGPVALHDVFGCAAVVIGLGELLANAFDPDGDRLSIANLTVSSGTMPQVAGGWSFAAASAGPVTVTYAISDGALSAIQTAHFNVVAARPILGTPGADVLAAHGLRGRHRRRAGRRQYRCAWRRRYRSRPAPGTIMWWPAAAPTWCAPATATTSFWPVSGTTLGVGWQGQRPALRRCRP